MQSNKFIPWSRLQTVARTFVVFFLKLRIVLSEACIRILHNFSREEWQPGYGHTVEPAPRLCDNLFFYDHILST